MERHIILAHKLIELHMFRVLPPLLPVRWIACSNRYISNRCIKPNIEDLNTIRLERKLSIWKKKWILTCCRKLEKMYCCYKRANPSINITTLSLNFSSGTGTPHLRSRVMQRGLSPSLSHAYVAWIAFWLQDPITEVSSI